VCSTPVSRRTVFRRIAQRKYGEWPAYDTTPLYDRTSLAGLESDIRTVSETWFDHESHDSVEEFVCALPLAYFRFSAHDRYAGPTRYQMATLFPPVIALGPGGRFRSVSWSACGAAEAWNATHGRSTLARTLRFSVRESWSTVEELCDRECSHSPRCSPARLTGFSRAGSSPILRPS
jgi:hypothetical protein